MYSTCSRVRERRGGEGEGEEEGEEEGRRGRRGGRGGSQTHFEIVNL
jgi:hypothetical protein